MKVSYCSKTDLGTKYPVNTDALGDKITKNGHVFVVADGYPSDQNGSYVSKLAVQSVLDFFDKEQFDNIYIGINHAFQFVNEQIYRATISNENLKGSYVSLALLLVRPEGAYYGHVGNAKVAIQSDDQLLLLTKDHGFLEVQPYQAGGNTSRIIKALGNTPSVYPSVCNSPILGLNGDVILLATNGIFKSFNLDQLNEGFDYSSINKDIISLIDRAKGNGISDNLTLQLIAVTEGNDKTSSLKAENSFTPKIEKSPEEVKKNMFNIAGIERNRVIQIGGAIIVVFLVIWFVFRTPKDDTDIVLDDAGEVIKADTTNPHQDLESMMEYETPKEKVEEEKEEVEEEEVEEEEEEITNETEAEVETEKEEKPADEPKKEEVKSSKSGAHIVKSGDNLGKIAEKYHIKIDALKKANNIKDDQINIGQELKIPN
jgi:serine/threonine protein phosphatase PrpC/LysM repeat protein